MFNSTYIMQTEVNSPITHQKATFLYSIPSCDIIKLYQNEINVNVKYLLQEFESISLYQCNQTGYRFFYPFNIDGDSQFYEKLEEISWYYAEWKWDYDVANRYIHSNTHVLDIGCGEGKFLQYLKKKKKCTCAGLELNETAQKIAANQQLNVVNEFIQDYAKNNSGRYDTVTFFQVLEHIADIDSFMTSAIEVVKPGGQLIIAVPNNDPYYLKYDKNHVLNLPPHHMGWWNDASLRALGNLYNLKTVQVEKQPLQHYAAYTKALLTYRFHLPKKVVNLLAPFIKPWVYLNRNKINGASIMIVFEKSV